MPSVSPSPQSTAEDPEWRLSFKQPQRNAQVIEIAKQLAGLEPGATANSKKFMAMKFEDVVFRESASLADYNKRIAKKLKKLKKSYKPPANSASAGNQERERELQQILQEYGADLEYVMKHAPVAIKEMRKVDKFKDTANYLEGRTKSWVSDLGVGLNGKPSSKPSSMPTAEKLREISKELKGRLVWLRSCVAKFADPNEFLLGSLRKMETEFRDKSAAVQMQASVFQQHCGPQMLQSVPDVDSALGQATRLVPPTLTSKAAAEVHLDKMRAASNVVLGYMCSSNKYKVSDPKALEKVHQEVSETSLEPVMDAMKEVREKETKNSTGIQLSSAWFKPLPERTDNTGTQIRSRVLLTASRKPPPSLVSALKEKGVRLVRPPPTGAGSHLILDFAPAFTMTIYLVPLVVTLRGYQPQGDDGVNGENRPLCASFPPLHTGLLQSGRLSIGPNLASGDFSTIGEAIQDRLQDASMAATRCLRSAFHSKAASAKNDFEREVLEASALLEFIQQAKETYNDEQIESPVAT